MDDDGAAHVEGTPVIQHQMLVEGIQGDLRGGEAGGGGEGWSRAYRGACGNVARVVSECFLGDLRGSH